MKPHKFFIYRAIGICSILLIVFLFNYFHPRPERSSIIESPNSSTSTAVEQTLFEQLSECLPKSDLQSKQKCDELIASINSFEGCVSAGFEIMKSDPEQCETPDQRIFKATRLRSTLTGTYICLPHRQNSGPQTEECAFGIKTENGNYALSTMLLRSYFDYSTGDKIEVVGYIVPIEELSSDFWQKYDVKGIMNLTEARVVK